jgi:hypothetical protein
MFRRQLLPGNTATMAAMVALLIATPIHAADTVEPFDVGATDFELYAGIDGLGLDKNEKTVFGDVVLGYGILERLSGYFGTTLESNAYLAEGVVGFAFGIYGNVLDFNHVDVDLFLDFSGGMGDFAVTPSFEFNLDADPEMETVGVYLRGGVPLYGRPISGEADVAPEYEMASQVDVTFGAYVSPGHIHQLLLEFDAVFRPDAVDDEHDVELGGVALGYNVMLTDNLELINQAYLDIPQNGEDFAVGVSTGFIATLP